MIDATCSRLVLGSMPGIASLRAGEYYAHPRNLFWHFVESLFGVSRSAPYPERLSGLLARHIALWDVLHSCTRTSSLDSDIVASSIVPNDFAALFRTHPSIRRVCFNGAKAEEVFRKHVLPEVACAERLTLQRLPSTSPANASIPFEVKADAWQVLAAPEVSGAE